MSVYVAPNPTICSKSGKTHELDCVSSRHQLIAFCCDSDESSDSLTAGNTFNSHIATGILKNHKLFWTSI
jgi:hypothetical protein